MTFAFLGDEDLEKLINSGAIVDYTYKDNYERGIGSQSLEITFPCGQKLIVSSWSTPAPESSGLCIEVIQGQRKANP